MGVEKEEEEEEEAEDKVLEDIQGWIRSPGSWRLETKVSLVK